MMATIKERAEKLVQRMSQMSTRQYVNKTCDIIADAVEEIDQLRKDLDFAVGTNNFDAKRLRRLANLVGASTPESDETLLGCAGTVIGSICHQVEGMFKQNELEREIAYHAARSDIECICAGHHENGPGSPVWYDLQSPDNDDDRGFISQAETYLGQRKLLTRHPDNHDWVRPLDAGVRP